MSTTPELHGPVDPELDAYEDDGFDEALPIRPKRPFLTKWSVALLAVAVTAIGFYGGVELEKSKTTTTGSSSALAGASAGTRAGGTARTGASARTGAAGATGAPGGFGGSAASNGTSGTVSSVDGKTIYLKDSAGNTVKAKLSSGTTITKSEKVGNGKVYPGDSIVISGTTGKNGEITATSVTDSGASASSTSTTSTTS